MSIRKDATQGPIWMYGTEIARGRPSPTFGRGRVCAVSGCGTRLSMYNAEVRCAIHNHPLY
jgi:hypothetical protein